MKWLRWIGTNKARERELDKEIEADFALEIQQRLEAGATREEAEFAARRNFGNVTRVKEVTREMWGWAFFEQLGQDIRFALRLLIKAPGFAATVILVLACGISATSALFSVVNAVLLRPLPYLNPERLAVLWIDDVRKGIHESAVPYPTFEAWKLKNKSFTSLAFVFTGASTISGGNVPERVDMAGCSDNLFALLGVSPTIGRSFTSSESSEGQPVVIISHALWQRRLAGSSTVVGSHITVDGRDLTIVGALPASFAFPSLTTDLWLPLKSIRAWSKLAADRQRPLGFVVGRLKPGATVRSSQANLDVIGQHLAQQNPDLASNSDFPGFHGRVVSLPDQARGKKLRIQLWALLAAVTLVLLIACVNVASLLLAKSSSRQHEIAVRKAIGASRSRILRQLMIESGILAALSGATGVAFAPVGIRIFAAIAPPNLLLGQKVALDIPVLLFAVAISAATGLAFGIAPALQTSAVRADEALRAGARTAGTKAAGRLRSLLVSAEIGLAVLLVCSAGLLLKSFLRLQEVPLGFQPTRVLLFRSVLPQSMSEVRQTEFYDDALRRLREIPGVMDAGAISNIFISASPDTTIIAEGRPASEYAGLQVADDVVTPGFFQALRVPLKEGRLFSASDLRQSGHVSIVTDAFARRFWPGQNALGKRFQFADGRFSKPWVTVVGIVGDIRRNGLETEAIPQVFLPMSQLPSRGADFVIRSNIEPEILAPVVRREMAKLDGTIPVYHVSTLEQRLSQTIAPRRFQTFLFGSFAVAAVLLAAIGIYGLARFTTMQRIPELGVRIALGATSAEIVELILKQNLRLAFFGLILGTCGALVVTRAIGALLFEVSYTDPFVFALGPVSLLVIMIASCAHPAWLAAKTDPVAAAEIRVTRVPVNPARSR